MIVGSQPTARFLTAHYIVQGQDTQIACPLVYENALIEPDEGTVTIYEPNGTVLVNAAAIEIESSMATYRVLGTATSARARGMGWRVVWHLTTTGGFAGTRDYGNAAGLVRSELAPVVADADLYRRENCLNPAGPAPVSTLTTYQDKIDEAWTTLHGRMCGKGSLPHLVMEPAALREAHLTLTLHLIFEDFRTRLNETWREKAVDYETKSKAAWSDLRFEYDTSDTGSSTRRKRSAGATAWLTGID